MPIKQQSFNIQGMNQDSIIATGQSSTKAYEIMNLRYVQYGDSTTGSWTVEKGTREMPIHWSYDSTNPNHNASGWVVNGIMSVPQFSPVGQCIINDIVVIFAKTDVNEDIIFKLRHDSQNDWIEGYLLFKGDINLREKHPLETIGFYETESIQKAYWTDGFNQPRMINICRTDILYLNTAFDFVQEVDLNEIVTVHKRKDGSGVFPSGTVKYAISYYNKFGQETNIVWDSPLYYPIREDRGLNPDGKELSGDSFAIGIKGLDTHTNFDYLRIYSIFRSVDGTTPICKIVADIKLPDNRQDPLDGSDSITFIDTNTTGETIDPTILWYLGGKEILAETFDQKDNTLFLGNLTLKRSAISDTIKSRLTDNGSFADATKQVRIHNNTSNIKYYEDLNQLNEYIVRNVSTGTTSYYNGNSFEIKHFKKGETYRFGVQFQDDKGNWSEVIWIGDRRNDINPDMSDNNWFKPAKFTYRIPNIARSALVYEKFKKARLVCVYPTNADRDIICQGVLNPTLWNSKWSNSHSPDRMASWFFRPDNNLSSNQSGFLPFEHGASITGGGSESREIQSINGSGDSSFKIDRNILTLNSPEVEYDETFASLDSSKFKLRVVGRIPIGSIYSTTYLKAGLPMMSYRGTRGDGFVKQDKFVAYPNPNGLSGFTYSGYWEDTNVYKYTSSDNDTVYNPTEDNFGRHRFPIYPFQRTGALNNFMTPIESFDISIHKKRSYSEKEISISETAKLSSKVFSSLKYSANNNYYTISQDKNTDRVVLVNNDEVLPTLVNSIIYYGSIDDVAPCNSESQSSSIKTEIKEKQGNSGDYVTTVYGRYWLYGQYVKRNNLFSMNIIGPMDRKGCASDPVTITYKSTPHYVVKLNGNDTLGVNKISGQSFLYLGEIYRTDVKNRFGGQTEEAFLNNNWVPCGPAVSLPNTGDVILEGLEGDTYYQRYDCLKTAPLRPSDCNQIVEILSFMVESRINLNGRYDIRKGWLDNTTTNTDNFNKINLGYTQKNDFFIQKTYNKWFENLDKFKNQFTWTKTKIPGEDIDTWTNITLSGTADADGTLGSITKIINGSLGNSKLLLFQDHGIGIIGFNEKAAIQTSLNVPIELASNNKYTGLTYITRNIGCQNKWSICNTPSGVMFIDDSRHQIYRYLDALNPLSTQNGFDSYLTKELPNPFNTWHPNSFENIVTYYDKDVKDTYFISNEHCLSYNEIVGNITSFYNYEHTPYIFNISGKTYAIKNGRIHMLRNGNAYSEFFGNRKDFWMTLLCDGVTQQGNMFDADKVFNNIEFSADMYDSYGVPTIDTRVFNKVEAWNQHQMPYRFDLDAKRRFNLWNAHLPRATYGLDQAGLRQFTRDRLRSTFCFIKLINTEQLGHRGIVHNFNVSFNVR